jgi:hypothetical protein
LTFRKRAAVLSGYKAALDAGIVAGTTVRREQPTVQMAEVIVTRKQGGCFCTADAAGLSATRQGTGPCGCSR